MNDKGEPTKAALAMFDPKGEKVWAGLSAEKLILAANVFFLIQPVYLIATSAVM